MQVNKFSNAIIILLSLSAIYLTGQLWFETLSNRNFFYSVLSPFSFSGRNASMQAPHIVKPYRFITNSGTDGLYIDYDDSPQKLVCDNAIELVLRKGEFAGSEPLDWNTLLAGRSYMFEYAFPLPASFFAEAFGQKTINLSSRVDTIDALCLAPSRTDTEKTIIKFIDKQNKTVHNYTINAADINAALLAGLNTQRGKPDGIFYVSSAQNGLTMFKDNDFVPQWLGDSLEYNVTRMTNPYAPKGDLILHTIQPNIEYLFDRVVYSGLANGVYTFSDENTVVRYYPSDVLEFSDYHIIDKIPNPTMAGNYRAALMFLERDTAINNYYYLSGVDEQDNVYTFYFDYNVNGYPLKLPDSFAADIKMPAPIIITTENNNVFKYKKLVYNFYADNEYTETATASFIDSYNSILQEGSSVSSLQLDSVSLAYKMEQGKYLRLHWFMDINDVCMINSAQSKRGE